MGSGGGPGMLFYPPHSHFRQLWNQKWQKAAAPLTIKPWAEPLNCPCVEGELFPPRPTLGTRRWGKKNMQGGRGRRGCADGQNGSMDGKVWVDFGTATWGSRRQVEKSPSFTAPLKAKDLRLKLGHDWNQGAVYGFWMSYVGWYFYSFYILKPYFIQDSTIQI